MRLFELFEAKPAKKTVPTQKNPVAKYAKTTGAGAHEEKKYTRKEKHKKEPKEE
jgi:hypothetical protein